MYLKCTKNKGIVSMSSFLFCSSSCFLVRQVELSQLFSFLRIQKLFLFKYIIQDNISVSTISEKIKIWEVIYHFASEWHKIRKT